jgi:hypothetical protein
MAINEKDKVIRTFYGASTDTKPTGPPYGSTFYETDTGATYRYHGSWELITTLANVTLKTADIEIGAVEIKNASNDDRAAVDSSGRVAADLTRFTAKDMDTGAGTSNALPVAVMFAGATPDAISGDSTNGLDVDVTRVSGTVSVKEAPEVVRVYATGSGNINETINPSGEWQLEDIRLHLSAVVADNLTVQVDAGDGAAYDQVLLVEDCSTLTDVLWQPPRPLTFETDDNLVITLTNIGAATYGLVVVYSLI